MSLEEYLQKNNVWHRFLRKSETIHTADAAEAAGIPLNRVTKNLISITDDGEYILLIVPGDRKVDLDAAAAAVNTKTIRLVPFSKAEGISGYPPGGTPSIGHRTRLRTIMEKGLLQYDTVYCGGGSRDKLLELRVQDIIKLNVAIVADIVEKEKAV
ncbi:aminoacyl-tRNA deacylase [Candidatus Bathyarchaeota archaeon]|nr:aminoacyl-tRNA deacylase [Candidatus Bathyarchaeota archaeon]